jgi:hypothetical protein
MAATRQSPFVDHEVGLQPRKFRFEVLRVHLVERVRGTKGPQSVRGQRCVHLLARREMNLMPGSSRGDRQWDKRVRVTDRRKAGKQHAHAEQPTPGNPAPSFDSRGSTGTAAVRDRLRRPAFAGQGRRITIAISRVRSENLPVCDEACRS